MKIIYHEKFENSDYARNPAAERGRIESIKKELKNADFSFVKPKPASENDLELVHSKAHITKIKERSELLFEVASLAAGGAIEAAEIAFEGEPAFGLIRPPGHHASSNSCWGFCYFNNMAVALEKLRTECKIDSAYILDFDLHTGDGNINILGGRPGIQILNPEANYRREYLDEIEENFENEKSYDIIGVSAGFDEHVEDWGNKLTTPDYEEIGSLVKEFSERKSKGRRFSILEGGYNHRVLGKNVKSFLNGFK